MFPYILPDDICHMQQQIKDLQDQIMILEKSVQTIMDNLKKTDGQPEAAEPIPSEPEKLSDSETGETEAAPKPRRKAAQKKKEQAPSSP